MTTALHVMPESFSGNIVVARMRESDGHLIATTDSIDVTKEAIHAVAYHYYVEASQTPEKAVAYEFTLNNGHKIALRATIISEGE